ncbi:Hint domain-containing protein [Roseomonas sp. CAU 1739]|uniref:Hint domain-containing protein n=1 Tax=Roseomonas sp. CAU 1739 TaxID=3140364 RepID=UPI00325B7CF1
MTDISPDCGLPIGTPVLTPTGHVPVETLRPGALVLAISGTSAPFQALMAVRRVRWSGPMVRLKAEALDDGAPQEDLLLPPHHALLIDGSLISAGALVDGHGVLEEPATGPVDLVQITLAAHDAVLAAGLAVETARPDPEAPDCLPRRAPQAALRAMLAWRAERLGWAIPAVIEPEPDVGSLRDRLAASPLAAALPLVPPLGGADSV